MRILLSVPALLLAFWGGAMAQVQPESVPAAIVPVVIQGAGVSNAPSVVPQYPLLGGVPSGRPTGTTIPLSLSDAIKRGLDYNLGALLSAEQMRAARGARLVALSRLLPRIEASVAETQQQVNLEAFGFQGFPGVRTVVGPFNVFDVRASYTQTLLDFPAINRYRAEKEITRAAGFSNENARDLVVYVCANLYLQAVASGSRIETVRAQVNTAQALYELAVDQKAAGVVAGIDVLRAQVELQAQQQRLIVAEDQFEKDKLSLARAIGLPLGQEFTLTDGMPYSPLAAMSLEQALERAYRDRPDYQGLQALVRAAELERKSAKSQRLPSIGFSADYGIIGSRPWDSHGSFAVATVVRVPLFQGGSVRGVTYQAEALLRQRQAELEDLRGQIYYEIKNAFLDLKAAADRVQVAQSAVKLAEQQVVQSQDRFSAGVTNNVEVVQAQEALATASENYIASLQAHSAAKLALARAVGVSETEYQEFLSGP